MALYVGAVIAAAWLFSELRFARNRDFPLATPSALALGTAYRPFQYRVLVPWLAAATQRATGLELRSMYQVLEGSFSALLVFSFFWWLRAYFSRRASVLLSFVILPVISFNLLFPRGLFAIWLPYDVPSAMFFALLSALLVRERWRWIWLVFPLAVLNRETVVFLVGAYAVVAFDRRKLRGWMVQTGTLMLVWIAAKIILRVLYGNNPGADLEWAHVGADRTHLATNLAVLTSAQGMFHVAQSFGFLWLLPLACFAKLKDRYLRAALLMFLPYFATVLLFGNVHELRVYAEWAPIILTSAALILFRR